jgi:3-methyladenine DNA glycosylase Tag
LSLLTLVQDAADRLGVVRPTSVVGSADQQVRQLLSLAQQEGKELSRRFAWQVLTKEQTITATATETQANAIPADFDRVVNDTFYNRTANRKVEGPLNAQEWADYKASVSTVLFDAFRVRGDSLLLAPTPTAGDSYVYEYVSTWWCTTSAGTTGTLAAWASDDDIGILPEELMTLGVVWRFLRAKGLDYAEAFRSYEVAVMQRQGWDGGKRITSMARGPGRGTAPRIPSFPDSSWNL